MRYTQFIAATALLALAACGGNSVKTTLGLDRGSPDAFRVVSRPPLSVPPEFNLTPPSATAQPPGEQPASKEASSMLFGGKPTGAKDKKDTSAETEFLKKAGAGQADPNIREEMAEQHYIKQQKEDDSSWWDVLSTNPPKKDPVVNAQKESQRIDQNQAEGQPVTNGTTPMAKQNDTGVLGRLLGY